MTKWKVSILHNDKSVEVSNDKSVESQYYIMTNQWKVQYNDKVESKYIT